MDNLRGSRPRRWLNDSSDVVDFQFILEYSLPFPEFKRLAPQFVPSNDRDRHYPKSLKLPASRSDSFTTGG